MKAYVFPGQGAQFPGMGKELYESDAKARELFDKANEILGFKITDIMFGEDAEALKATNVTQPAVFLHSVICERCSGGNDALGASSECGLSPQGIITPGAPDMVAGHSLGEFSALVACGALSFEDALRLVAIRASAMQKCCEMVPGTMAAIIGGDASIIESTCAEVGGIVVPANYNGDSQIVISGEVSAVTAACEALKAKGVKRALPLQVGGAFHSPLMEPARKELGEAIEKVSFKKPVCPIYQNVDAQPHTDPNEIKANLLMQLTSPVRWTQSVRNMIADGADSFTEFGPGTVLQNLIKKINPEVSLSGVN